MPNITIRTLVPGKPEQVFTHVTGFATTGPASQKALEQKHGRLISQEDGVYIFEDDTGDGATWHCTFDPPHRRIMRAPEAKWADRWDLFEPYGEGTLWTLVWVPKAKGIQSFTQWFSFQLRGKTRVNQGIIMPVVRRFQEGPSGPRRAPRRGPRRRRG